MMSSVVGKNYCQNQSQCIARLDGVYVERGDSWNHKIILNGVNFSLPQRSLIGLIGPSGCGKTTLLRSLIGLIKVKSGSVQLAGYRNDEIKSKLSPSFIGYMPQDIGLHDLWSAREMFKFAARVYGIGWDDLEHRITELQQKIDLPMDLGLMSSMSGGEKRRVSLALALIHRPKLLLLDEPTVGSDPLSRLKIWNYLVECQDKLGTTIVITTHYMDEVRKADTIAFMYAGQVLRHEKPTELMIEYGTRNLEETTVIICKEFLSEGKVSESKKNLSLDPFSAITNSGIDSKKKYSTSFSLILASFLRIISEWRFLLVSSLVFSYWFMIADHALLSFLWKPPANIPIHIATLQSELLSTSQLSFINDLNNTVELMVKISSLDEATSSVQKGHSIGTITFNPSYDANLLRRALDFEKDEAVPPLVHFYGDFSDLIKVRYVERLLELNIKKQILTVQNNHSRVDRFLDIVKVEPIDGLPVGENTRRVSNYLLPILLYANYYALGQGIAGFGVVFDKLDGFYERQLIMGVESWQLLTAHIVRHILVSIPIHITSTIALLLSCNIPIDLSIWPLILFIAAVDLAAGSTGMYLATKMASTYSMMCIIFFYNVVIIWINALVWPIESLPYFKRIFLITFPYEGLMRDAQMVLKGYDVDIFSLNLLLVLLWTIVFFGLSIKNHNNLPIVALVNENHNCYMNHSHSLDFKCVCLKFFIAMNRPFVQQLWALVRKDLTIRRRCWFVTFLELSLPILIAWLAVIIGSKSEPSNPQHAPTPSRHSPFPANIQTYIYGTTYYTPNSSEVEYIIDYFRKKSIGTSQFPYCSSEEEMISKIEPNSFYVQGIVFDASNPGSKFTIRQEPNPSGPPKSLKNEEKKWDVYWWSSFIGINWQITVTQITGAQSKSYMDNPPLLDTFYYESSSYQPVIQNIMLKAIVVGIVFGNLIIITIAGKRVATEKLKGSKELLRMMGVPDHTYWIAQFINYIPIFLIQAIVISSIVFSKISSLDGLFIGFLFMVLIIFLSNLLITFAITTIVNRPILVQIAINVLIISGLSAVLQSDSKAIPSIDRIIFFPSSSFFFWLIERQDIPGAHPLTYFLFIPTWLIFGFLLIYLDAVCPWQPGTPKRWNFMFHRTKRSGNLKEAENGYSANPEKNTGRASIICSDVYKSYSSFGSKKLAVEDLSLEIQLNQITVLLGHNGAGKTTLMSMITGFTSSTSGKILVNGFDVQRDSLAARRSLALCPQHECLYENLTTRENLKLCANLRGNDSTIVTSALNLLELSEKSSVLASKLSGGMRRRLQLAMALVTDADTIILDEPTSGLDPETRRTVWDYLLSIRRRKTILISTHFMEEADALADQIVIMSAGQVKCVGSPMYLKTKLGAGYLVKIAKSSFNRDAMQQNISRFYPHASATNETSEEICFNLNVEEADQHAGNFFDNLANFCDVLDSKKKEIGISSYTIATATLEDVFMKIAVDEGIVSEDRVTFSQVRENTLAELSDALDYQKGSAVSSIIQSFRGLFCKRFQYMRRDFQHILYSLIIPCAIVFFLARSIVIDNPEISRVTYFTNRQVSPDLYSQDFPKLKIIFSGTDKSALRNCFEKINKDGKLQTIQTNLPISDYIKESGLDPETFDSQYLFGIQDRGGPKSISIFMSGSYSYSFPIGFVNYLNILRCLDSKDLIVANEHPFPQSPYFESFYGISLIKRVVFLFTLPVALAFTFSAYYIFPSKEISTKARLIQSMAGLGNCFYWIPNLTFDLVYHTLISSVIIILVVSGMSSLLLKIDIIGTLFTLLLTAGFSGISWAYLLSFTKINHASGFNILTTLYSISGAVASIYLTLALDISDVAKFFPTLVKFQPLMRAIPPIGITSALARILEISQIVHVCPSMRDIFQRAVNQSRGEFDLSYMRKYCLDNLEPKYLEIISPDLIPLISSGLILFTLTQILSSISGRLSKCISSVLNKIARPITHPELVEDEDVVTEIDHVDQSVLNHKLSNEASLVRHITKDYFSWKLIRFRAVHDVSFSVHKRECFGLLGVNGAGKTTTFSMLTGDIPMTRGDAYVGKLHVSRNLVKYRENVSYCPQVDALLDLLTPGETLTLFARLRGIPEKDIPKNVDFIIDSTDLTKFRKTLNGNLSGGNKRKLGLAIAAIGGPSVIFLDEPTTGVDPASRRKIWATLIGLRESGRSSIVLTSHSMDECEALCNRIAIMSKGQIRCIGSSTHLKNKFGQGYTLIIKMKDESGFSSVNESIVTLFACAKLQDHHGTSLQYHLTEPNLRWADMFRTMKQVKNRCPIENFYINDTSIEQIFLSFAQTESSSQV
ncbi:phospholipid-transporting ATPase ABCA3-like [Brevipalpus obovatus]|uniref:phospholipid-transporting ATPase ABCA3-like n=1 Tax=Brevipalpus obovatus TaxID=246614 RepID=UPI003D9F662B